MIRVSATEFRKGFGRHQKLALIEPVVIVRSGKETTVLLSATEYRRLKRRDREALSLSDFSREDIDAIERTVAPPQAAGFDNEV
jgi:PHD/YefM family antitoxin component YafN of YafNO toxin-antitoxin module